MRTLRLPATPNALPFVRRYVRERMQGLGMDPRADNIVLAVNEAVSNCVRRGGGGEGHVEVRLDAGTEGVVVTVKDEGGGPGQWRDTAERGLAGMIMEGLADSVSVRGRSGRGTEVVLTFLRDTAPGS